MTFFKWITKTIWGDEPHSPKAVSHSESNSSNQFVSMFDHDAECANSPGDMSGVWQGAIHAFLQRDYRSMGYADALVQSSVQRRDSRMKCIAAIFRHCLELDSQQIEAQLVQLEYSAMETMGLNVLFDEEMALHKAFLESLKMNLENQEWLSREYKGWVSVAMAAYKEGFMTGASYKQQEGRLLGGRNTIVNVQRSMPTSL